MTPSSRPGTIRLAIETSTERTTVSLDAPSAMRSAKSCRRSAMSRLTRLKRPSADRPTAMAAKRLSVHVVNRHGAVARATTLSSVVTPVDQHTRVETARLGLDCGDQPPRVASSTDDDVPGLHPRL